MKRTVFQLANALRKSGLSLSESLKRGWAVIKLKAQMMVKDTAFSYIKDDGTKRTAIGFYGLAPQTKSETPQPATALAIRYFDTVADAWRSFRADRLVIA